MKATALADAWGGLRAQLAASARLRVGLLIVFALVWAYALSFGADAVDARRLVLAVQREDLDRLRSLERERDWPARAEEARRQATALRALLWPENDLGLAEAALQDWVRATALRSGLTMRELSLSRASASAVTATGSNPGVATGPGAAPPAIKARLIVELNRPALLNFLAEVATAERAVMVDRLLLRTQTQPPVAEIDLRVHVALPPGPPR